MMAHADIGYLLNKATRRFRLRLCDSLAQTGLRPQQAAALIALARSGAGKLTPTELADAIDTDPATTSGLIERLTRDGWIGAMPNPDDGRSRLIGLTAKAEEALPAVMVAANAVSAEATSCLTADEVATLGSLLARLCESDEKLTSKRAGSR